MTKRLLANPDSQEREYTRLLVGLSKRLQKDVDTILVPELARLLESFENETRQDSWLDDLASVFEYLVVLADQAVRAVLGRLPKQAELVERFNDRQFKLVVKANAGVNLPDPTATEALRPVTLGVGVFRHEPFLAPLVDAWVKENAALIKTIPERFRGDLERIINRGVRNGWSVRQLTEEIKAVYPVSDRRARLIAQDQILTFNADLTRFRLRSVGVTAYRWRTVQDNRVRPEHAERNGKRYTFESGAGGEHPGQPIRCRCRAEPIWPGEDQ